MPNFGKILVITASAIGAFALLLLIISVGTVTWLDDGNGSSVGLFRRCVSDSLSGSQTTDNSTGCYNYNQPTQGGLSVFGLLLLAFGVIAAIASIFINNTIVIYAALGLFYFSSMFVMAAYATWGVYARDPSLYFFPNLASVGIKYTSMGASYNLCVAAHYFLWTALTILAFAVGYFVGGGRNTQNT